MVEDHIGSINLIRFAETSIKGCYLNEVQNYISYIQAAMKETILHSKILKSY